MARHFDGSNDRVHVLANLLAGLDSATMTLAGWVRRDTSDPTVREAAYTVAANLVGGAERAKIMLNAPGTSGFTIEFFYDWDGVNGIWGTDNDFALGVWHHIAITYDRSGAAPGNDPLIYVNGVSEAFTEDSTPTGSPVGGLDSFRMGEDAGAGQDYGPGDLCEFGFWDVILTQDEITALQRFRPGRVRPLSNKIDFPVLGVSPEPELAQGRETAIIGTTISTSHAPVAFNFPQESLSSPEAVVSVKHHQPRSKPGRWSLAPFLAEKRGQSLGHIGAQGIWKGMVWCFPLWGDGVEAIEGMIPQYHSAGGDRNSAGDVFGSGPHGLGFRVRDGVAGDDDILTYDAHESSERVGFPREFSLLVFLDATSRQDSASVMVSHRDTVVADGVWELFVTSGDAIRFFWNSEGSSNDFETWPANSWTTGPHVYVITIGGENPGPGTMELWKDGVSLGKKNPSTHLDGPAREFNIGALSRRGGDSGGNVAGLYYCVYHWERKLEDWEIALLSDDPFLPIREEQRGRPPFIAHEADASLAATALISAIGFLTHGGMANLAATAVITATGILGFLAQAILTAFATITASATAMAILIATATIKAIEESVGKRIARFFVEEEVSRVIELAAFPSRVITLPEDFCWGRTIGLPAQNRTIVEEKEAA